MICYRCPCKKKTTKRGITVHDYIQRCKRNIYKNLALLSFNQLAMYLLYKVILMSRMYEYDYPGLYGYLIYQIAQACTIPILPALIFPRFKLKRALFCGSIFYMIFVSMQLFNQIEIKIAFALLMAPAFVIVHIIQQIYVIRLAKIMCKVTGRSIEITLTQMTGIFLSIYRISETICYIPMMLADKRTLKYQNTSKINCGLNFYYGQHENVTELSIPPQGEISHIASLVLIILALVTSVITLILLKPLQTLTMTELNADPEPRSWMSTINLIKTQQLRLIIPMTLFSGYEKVFLRYDYLMAYIGCNKNRYDGMDQYILGTVLYCQMSLSIAPLVSTVNTEIILLVAGILYLIPTLLLLANVKIEAIGYYCISGIWSLASSIWDCLIHALYGVLFPKDELEAYAQMGLWQSISIAMSVLLTLFSGTFVKLWILLILSLLSIITVILLPFIKSGLHNKVRLE
ncbi:UNC93-like protein isoform X2 [Cephus cinctus]|uniref:UNC93-like protein isoform X2 n=1 Tax=Cephus cinctus TaxID=211228 RepID=A0AAJ7VXM8_CEPCN|nr:UNC93-like protein isoform X2 [Cephus cinctus]